MKGARALAGGMLILAVVCAVPAVSAAQDGGSPDPTTTPADPPAPIAPDPGPPTTTDSGPGPSAGSDGKAGRGGGGDPGDGDRGDGGDQAAPLQADTAQPAAETTDRAAREAHSSAATKVTMGDFFFSPATVTVSVGEIVTWRNGGHTPHTATADDGSFDTGVVTAGQSSSHMFTKSGTFTYVCTIHPNMKGTVRVLSSGGGGGGGATAGTSSSAGPSEAAAANSPDAAGNSTTLPMTGMAAGALALVGLALLGSGLLVRRLGDPVAASNGSPGGARNPLRSDPGRLGGAQGEIQGPGDRPGAG